MIVSIAAMAMLFVGCSSMMSLSTYGPNDLYRTNNRAEVAAQLKAEAEAELIAAEARRAQYEALIAQANADATEAEYYAMLNNEPSFTSVVANDYQSAYARRLYGFQSPTYNMPSSYYNMLNSSSIYYVTAYDPSYYNIMVSGDQVWVEHKSVTSMFGSWGATNVTFGIYASPWNYGWSYHVDPFYYSMWGYPRYSWYDWNWAMCYNPFYYDWYWGCYYDPFYPHHHHHHHHGYYPMPPYPGHGHGPDYRPGHTTGSGASMGPGNLNGNRGNTGSRYTSPTTNRNYGASDNRVSSGRATNGSTSQGFNSNSVRPSSGSSTNSRNNSVGSTRISSGTSTSSGSNFRQGSSTGSSSRSTSTTVTNTNRGSSSNNRVGSSQTGNYRQSSYSGSSSSRSSSSSSSSYRSSGSSSSSRSSSYSGGSSSSSRSSSSGSGSFRSGSSSSGSSRR